MRALVTGANGHIGYNLVRALLARGYEVVATVRSLGDTTRNSKLQALGPVRIVELDVRDADGFRRHCENIDMLYHLAATYALFTGDRTTDEDIINDSLMGATNAIKAAARQVRKVIMTSSIITLPMAEPGDPPATEKDWRTDLDVPYNRAKSLAEKRAWELAEQYGVKLVTLLPASIGGPGFLRRTPTTDFIEGVMLGSLRFAAPRSNFPYVDVRDVVEGHILAGEKDVSGRFILCNDEIPSLRQLAEVMHEIDPRIPLAGMTLPDFILPILPAFEWLSSKMLDAPRMATPEFIASIRGRMFSVSNRRARDELGWQPQYTLKQSLAETIATLRAMRSAEGRRN